MGSQVSLVQAIPSSHSASVWHPDPDEDEPALLDADAELDALALLDCAAELALLEAAEELDATALLDCAAELTLLDADAELDALALLEAELALLEAETEIAWLPPEEDVVAGAPPTPTSRNAARSLRAPQPV
jgi:hypothetical protein